MPIFYHLIGPQLCETRASTPTCRRLVRGERDTGCPQKDLMDMLARELKEELEARDQPKTGNKAWLRRRLHGAIVRAHLAERDREP